MIERLMHLIDTIFFQLLSWVAQRASKAILFISVKYLMVKQTINLLDR